MAGSTIGAKVTTGVTLSSTAGPGLYLSPLTVTRLGYVAPSSYDVAGIFASITAGYVLNQGRVLGGLGKLGTGGGNGDTGGGGVGLATGSLINSGTITGGSGGGGSGGGTAGQGGYGVALTGALVANTGAITGGGGGAGNHDGYGTGGTGGTGAVVGSGILINDGTVAGGVGGAGAAGGFGTNYGAGGVGLVFDAGSVSNDGSIFGGQPGGGYFSASGGIGVAVYGGRLTNTGAIIGASSAGHRAGAVGVQILGGDVVNHGTIDGGAGGGVFIGNLGPNGGDGVTLAAGSLNNDGVISGGLGGGTPHGAPGPGGAGVAISGGVLTNHGTITGARGSEAGEFDGNGGIGVDIAAGSVFNDGTITGGYVPFRGYGGVGVNFERGGTLTNGGLIVGGTATTIADAVDFGAGTSRLILEPGATFSGAVVANPAYGNVLQLSSGNTIGSIGGLGSAIDGFGTITIDQGATWIIAGNSAGLATGQTIEGFAKHDDIQLTGISATGSSYAEGVLTLTLTGGSVTLNIPGAFTTSDFIVDDFAGDTFISITCFRVGTRIGTVNGKVPVERLCVGDPVLVLGSDGDLVPRAITWIGHRSIDCERHPRPDQVWPVRIRAGAFGRDAPSRDLFLSPDHAVFVDDVLIPVKHLINGGCIVQVPMNEVSYFHIELQEHAVLFAEGLPTESYLDTGDRDKFANGGKRLVLFPDFATRAWESAGCAPLVVTGARLDAVRRRIDGGRQQRRHPMRAAPPSDRLALR